MGTSAVWSRKEDQQRALQFLEEMGRRAPAGWNFWGLTYRTWHGHVLLRLGETVRGRAILEETLRDARRRIDEGDERPGIRREVAAIYAVTGEAEQAYDWLTQAIDAGWRLEPIQSTPLFDAPRTDTRFEQLMARIDADLMRMRDRIELKRRG